MGFLENLQKKSKKTRIKMFAIAVFFSFVFVLFGFALSTKQALDNFSIISSNDNNEITDDIKSKLTSDMPSIRSIIKSSVAGILQLRGSSQDTNASSIDRESGNNKIKGQSLPRLK